MATWELPPMQKLKESVDDVSGPLAMRMRAVYYLRTVASPEAIGYLCEGLREQRNSPLLRHELAYVLGQIRDELACECLESTLGSTDEDVMVRHECAEALGAIGAARSLPALRVASAAAASRRRNALRDRTCSRVAASRRFEQRSIGGSGRARRGGVCQHHMPRAIVGAVISSGQRSDLSIDQIRRSCNSATAGSTVMVWPRSHASRRE